MAQKIFLVFAISVLMLLQFASATDTIINIKTLPKHEVQATAYDPDSTSFSVLEGGSFRKISDQYGDVSFIFSSDIPAFNLIVYIKNDLGENIMEPERFLNHDAGVTMDLRIAPANLKLVETPSNNTTENLTNQTQEIPNETIIQENIQDQNAGVTGSVLFGEGGTLSKVLYYALGVIGLLIIAFVILKLVSGGFSQQREIRVTKLSDIMIDRKMDKIKDYENIISSAEMQITEAKSEIDKIKAQDKITVARQKIEENKEKLAKLKQEASSSGSSTGTDTRNVSYVG